MEGWGVGWKGIMGVVDDWMWPLRQLESHRPRSFSSFSFSLLWCWCCCWCVWGGFEFTTTRGDEAVLQRGRIRRHRGTT